MHRSSPKSPCAAAPIHTGAKQDEERAMPAHTAPIAPRRALTESLHRYCDKQNYELCCFSDNWIFQITAPHKTHFLYGNDLGLNSAAVNKICKDKAATSQLLNHNKIPALAHHLITHPRQINYGALRGAAARQQGDVQNWEKIEKLFKSFNQDMVCKLNDGYGGKQILRAQTHDQLTRHINALFEHGRAIALSPFIKIDSETRFIILEGETLLAYEKIPSPQPETASPSWQHNLSAGAAVKFHCADSPAIAQTQALAHQAARVLNIRFAAIDVIMHHGAPQILEINSGITLSHVARWSEDPCALIDHIYHSALNTIFT